MTDSSEFNLSGLMFRGPDPRKRGNVFVRVVEAQMAPDQEDAKDLADAIRDRRFPKDLLPKYVARITRAIPDFEPPIDQGADGITEERRSVMLEKIPDDPHLVPNE